MKWSEIAEETVLLVFDEQTNFLLPQTQQKLAKDLFYNIKLIRSLADFKEFLENHDQEKKILFFIHLNHNKSNKGYDDFKASKISIKYPNLRTYYISSKPKKTIFQNGNDSFDVFSYDNFHEKIGNVFMPQSICEITLTDSKSEIIKRGIFLSHSSKDAEIVVQFKELFLESGLNCDPNQIKFTSEEDHGLAGGINIPADLKDFLVNDMGLFIQFLTPNYTKSRTCLNEEGAGWCLLDDKKKFIPLLIPPHDHHLLSWIKNTDKGVKINNKDSLLNIYQNRKVFFGSSVDITRLSKKIDQFIEYFNNEISEKTKR